MRLNDASISRDQVNALVRCIVACDVAKIAPDTFLLVDARNRAKGKVKIVEVGDSVEAFSHYIRNLGETLFVHPVG
jgi:hypothetical protein